MLSFAINWYYSKTNIFSYHLINVFIHITTSVFLYLTIYHILTKTYLSLKIENNNCTAQLVSLCALLLWALNPIQTQAITYIVQRMASMAAMFYIIAMFFYLQGRHAQILSKKIIYFAIVILCFSLAIGSKENSITLPFALILIEFLFLQNNELHKTKQRFLLLILVAIALLILFASMVFLNGEPLSLLRSYNSRSFSLIERLLTEPRVVINYLYQIFYPINAHLSLEHDIVISKGLMKPWTTLSSIFAVLLLLIFAIFTYRKFPCFSFAFLFFFLNHIIESTIIPLELAFEHRNYLPSMFLFLPFAQMLSHGRICFRSNNRFLSETIPYFGFLLILIFCFTTFSRNAVWATEKTLWEDTFEKAPKSARAAHNLGHWYRQQGQLKRALSFFIKAEELAGYSATPNYTKANALNGQGTIFYHTESPERAIRAFREALVADPRFEASQKNLTVTLLKTNQWNDALNETSKLLKSYPNTAEYLYLHALALLRNDQPEQSLIYLERALQSPHGGSILLLAKAAVHKKMKQYQEAKKYLFQYEEIDKGKLSVVLALFEISILENDQNTAKAMKLQIQDMFSAEELKKAVSENLFIPLYSKDIIDNILDRT